MAISSIDTALTDPADPASYQTLFAVASGIVTRWRTKNTTIPLFGQQIATFAINTASGRNGFTRVNLLRRKPVLDLVLSPTKEVRASQSRVEFTFAAGSTAVERLQELRDLVSMLNEDVIRSAVADLIPPM